MVRRCSVCKKININLPNCIAHSAFDTCCIVRALLHLQLSVLHIQLAEVMFLVAHGNDYVGAIVCKLDMHMNVRHGYISMLAARKEYRKLKISIALVQKAIEAMLADNADEVALETEMRNVPALRLYENLGFVRDKRLFRYYLNGVDALRLKLWFR